MIAIEAFSHETAFLHLNRLHGKMARRQRPASCRWDLARRSKTRRRHAPGIVAVPALSGESPGDFRQAVLYLQKGQLHQSEQAHRRALAKLPRHAPSLTIRASSPSRALSALEPFTG
jgi:hypothetical protein